MNKQGLWLCLSMLGATPLAQADSYLSTGAYYLQGQNDFSEQTPVTSVSIPLHFAHYEQDWQWSISTAWHQIETEENEIKDTTQGLGDSFFQLGYTWQSAPYLTSFVSYKLATGDADKGLSTGEDDLGFRLEVFQTVTETTSVFGHIGYSLNGKVVGSDIQNTQSASIGLGHSFGAHQFSLASRYQQSLYQSLDDQTALEAMVSIAATPRITFSLLGSYDNTETQTLGLLISRRF